MILDTAVLLARNMPSRSFTVNAVVFNEGIASVIQRWSRGALSGTAAKYLFEQGDASILT